MCLYIYSYDVRCVFIPSDDRSTWLQLVQKIIPLMEKEVQSFDGKQRHYTVLGESFGGCLAIRLAQAAPHIVSRLVLVRKHPLLYQAFLSDCKMGMWILSLRIPRVIILHSSSSLLHL